MQQSDPNDRIEDEVFPDNVHPIRERMMFVFPPAAEMVDAPDEEDPEEMEE